MPHTIHATHTHHTINDKLKSSIAVPSMRFGYLKERRRASGLLTITHFHCVATIAAAAAHNSVLYFFYCLQTNVYADIHTHTRITRSHANSWWSVALAYSALLYKRNARGSLTINCKTNVLSSRSVCRVSDGVTC